MHGIATLVTNRSIQLIAPEAVVEDLVRAAVVRHPAPIRR